jgi:hypothetical protein
MEPSHLEREYQLSGFLLLTYSATLEEEEEVYYRIGLKNKQKNSQSSLEDDGRHCSIIYISLQFPTSLYSVTLLLLLLAFCPGQMMDQMMGIESFRHQQKRYFQ